MSGIPTPTPEEIKSLETERVRLEEGPSDQAKRLFENNVHLAAKSICDMAISDKVSDRIRLQASQYVVERVLGRIQDQPPKDDDPYRDLMNKVMSNVPDEQLNQIRRTVEGA